MHIPVAQRLRYPVFLSYVATFSGLLLLNYQFGDSPLGLSLGVVLFGFSLGALFQLFSSQPLPKFRIGLGAFFAAFTLYLPIVVVTYGFALVYTPVLFIYAGIVVLGANLTKRLREPQTGN